MQEEELPDCLLRLIDDYLNDRWVTYEGDKWSLKEEMAREALGRAVGAQLTPDTMVSLMLQSEQKWMLIESFVTLVMKTRELEGLAERGDNEGQ